jgi:hypothetical protein
MLPTKLSKEPLKLTLIVLLLALRNNYSKYNLYINKSLLLTSLLEDFASFISRIVTSVKALKPSVIFVSYIPYLKKLIANKDLGCYSNAFMLVSASKFMLRYASHVACLHVLSACAGAQNPVLALNSNASSLPPLQCDHFVTLNLI